MSRTSPNLTDLMADEKKRLGRRSIKTRTSEWFRDLYYPSTASVTTVGALLAFVFFMVLWTKRFTAHADLTNIARLQPLEVGIALVFVPITVFAIGLSSRRTPSGVSLAEVLLKETYLFPIAVFVIGLLAIFIEVSTVPAAITLILLTVVLAVSALYRLVRVLLDSHRQYSSGVSYLKNKIIRSIDLAVDERIGKNLLIRELEKMKLEYSPFSRRVSPDPTFAVRHTDQGRVHNVLLDRLMKFSTELERIANQNGYAFVEKQVPRSITSILGDINPDSRTLAAVKSRYLTVLYGDPVGLEDFVIARFPQKLVPDETEQNYLCELARSAIVIRRQKSHLERVRRLMSEIKDQSIEAIKSAQTARLVDLLKVYTHLAETFLEQMTALQTLHSFSAARHESQSLVGGWNELKWIKDDLAEIHHRGCRSEDLIIAREVASVPFGIAYAAIRARDHLIFNQFVSFAQRLYSSARSAEDKDVRKLLFDRSWRHLTELADYGVAWELQHIQYGENAQALETVSDFGTTILLNFQELLKTSLDQEEVADFGAFAQASLNLFGHLRLERFENIREKLTSQKRQMLFGIASLILEKLLENPYNDFLKGCLGSVAGMFMNDVRETTKVFNDVYQDSTQELWGWHWWTKIPEQGGFVGGPTPRLIDFYCYLLVKICSNLDVDKITGMQVMLGRDILFDLQNQGRIVTTLHEIANAREKWGNLVPEEWLHRIPSLETLFERLVSSQKRDDEDRDIDAVLSSFKIREFKNAFTGKFRESSGLRAIFGAFNAFKDETTAFRSNQSGPRWGLNLLNDKKAFAEDSGYPCKELGESFAWQFSVSESASALEAILARLQPCACPDTRSIEEKVRKMIESLIDTGNKPRLILAGLDVKQLMELEKSASFIPKWHTKKTVWNDIPNFEGMLTAGKEEIPIFWFRPSQAGNFACVLDLPRCLTWTQKSPATNAQELEHVHDLFYFRIADLAKEDALRSRILDENPAWLQQQKEKDRFLCLRVQIQILETFEIDLLDKTAGCKIILED